MGIKGVGGPCHRKSALGCPQGHQKRREEKEPFRWGWAGGVPILVCQPWECSWRRGCIRQMVLGREVLRNGGRGLLVGRGFGALSSEALLGVD